MNTITFILLKMMAFVFNKRKKFNSYLNSSFGYINFTVGFITEDGNVNRAISFYNGRASALKTVPDKCDVIMRFKDRKTILEMLKITPNEMLTLILHNRMILEGNIALLQTFNFYISLLLSGVHRRKLARVQREEVKIKKKIGADVNKPLIENISTRKKTGLSAEPVDRGVLFLKEPYLAKYSLEDFPRLQWMLDRHFTVMPQVCPERPLLLTNWYKENGFEYDNNEKPWHPVIRQAEAFHYLMKEKNL